MRANYASGRFIHTTRVVFIVLAAWFTISGCTTARQNGGELRAIKAEAMRGGYRADLAALAHAAQSASSLSGDPQLSAMAHYWAGYALWQRAMNGVNRAEAPSVVEADVRAALAELTAAVKVREAFADAHAIAGLVEGWLTMIDPAQIREHATNARAHMAKAKELEPDNPRVLWAEATALLGTPRQFGGDPERALILFEQVALMRAEKSETGPSWGTAEALMSRAYGLVTTPGGDVRAAEEAATEALRLQPDWYYVRELLLPMIAAKKLPAS